MKTLASNKPSLVLVITAFAIIYIVWGSTYFFIQMAIHGFPPMLMGALRFFTAGVLLLTWCAIKGDKIWSIKNIASSAVSGLLMLTIATGTVIWVEKKLPSSIVGIMVSANPIWFLVLDKPNWKTSFRDKLTLSGILLGFGGVLLLFGEALGKTISGGVAGSQLTGMLLMLISPIAWCAGSLFSKKKSNDAPARVSSSWQMLIAGLSFIPASFINHEYSGFHFAQVPVQAWMALGYLIVFGSIGAYSAYVWLLSVRSATQVSTHSYVNPVIAVLLGVMFASEHVSMLQLFGLFVILFSLLLINFKKYTFKMPKFKSPQTPANTNTYSSAYLLTINK